MRIKPTKQELKALQYAGLMGHEFVSTRKNSEVRSECNTLESAIKDAKEVDGSVFQQLPKRQWIKRF